MELIIRFFLIISLGFGANYYKPDLYTLSRGQESSGNLNIPDTLRMLGIMVQFPLEVPDNPKTSGDGHFLSFNYDKYNKFLIDTTINRCDGFLVDRPPHNTGYFQNQLEAVGKYYKNISDENLLYTAEIISNSNSLENGYFTVSDTMEYYAKSDQRLAEFFTESIKLAKLDIESYFEGKSFTSEDVVFVVFHAGLSQDFSYPSFDPTIYDIKSAYIDEEMMQGIEDPAEILGDEITNGILLPETQNIIYFDVVEDIIGNPDYGIDDLCDYQYGLTGIFAFLLGYELGLPEMFQPESGDPGIGYFGLMDHGSNNGRGVIPAPPCPWTRIKAGWLNPIVIDPYDGLDTNIIVPALDIFNQVYQIKIAEDEYFHIENRNNYIISNYDIEFLQYLLWDDYLCDKCSINCSGLDINEIENHRYDIEQCVKDNHLSKEKFHYFDILDSLISYNTSMIIQGELENNIFSDFTNYDFGLPGSGILIWHIKEPNPLIYHEGVNSDLHKRHIQIEEADGAVDIGFESYTFFVSDAVNIGWRYDFWFSDNTAYLTDGNPNAEEVVFDNWSSPNSRTTDGAESFLSITMLDDTLYTDDGDTIYTSISDYMNINIQFNGGISDDKIEIVHLSDGIVQYLGNAVQDSMGIVFYAKGDSIYRHSNMDGYIGIDEYIQNEDSIIITCCINTAFDTVITTNNHYAWIDTLVGQIQLNENYIIPMGYIYEDSSYSSPNSILFSDNSLSFGDLDQDGLDEIITIEDGNIIARNSNGTLVNGFPTDGEFTGVPLIANILPPQYAYNDVGKPEIVCREGDDIIILSNRGERLRQLSSYDIDQPLSMVPFWRGDTTIALIDGSRLFLFDLDMDHSYWLNPRSRPSGFPLSTGLHKQNTSQNFRKQAYNYPNPITEGKTIFRFYVGSIKTTEVQVKIYNAAGYLVKDDLIQDDLTPYEFNEIKWDNIQVDAGLYLAEIKPDAGSSELVRLVVIK